MQAMSVLTVLFKATSHLRSHPTSSASKSSPQKFSHRLRRFLLFPSGNHSASEHDWSIATGNSRLTARRYTTEPLVY